MPPVITRFAPSPTGFLHLGHARAALVAERRARQSGGTFLLRMEDIDSDRCRPEFAAAVVDDLAWLGVVWDGPVRVQSAHLLDYRATLDTLAARGLLYPCFCTRADIAHEIAASGAAPHADPDGAPLYPGTCRRLHDADGAARIAAGTPFALRLNMARAAASVGEPLVVDVEGEGRVPARPERFGDVVLGRRSVPVSYHLCATHDDAAQGVMLVTRGSDLRSAADLQRLLQALMGWPATAYVHFPLIVGPTGQRLAKRDDALSLRAMRAAGRTAGEVRALAMRGV